MLTLALVGSAWAAPHTLYDAVTTDLGVSVDAVAVGDVSGDGRADVIAVSAEPLDGESDASVFVLVQGANGALGAATSRAYGDTLARVGLALGDLDEDGLLDVVVGTSQGFVVLISRGAGELAPPVQVDDDNALTEDDADVVHVVDIDQDGHLDVVTLGWDRGVRVAYGLGDGSFSETEDLASVGQGYNDAEVGDVNGDGRPDYVVMSGQSNAQLGVHPNDGAGGLGAAVVVNLPNGTVGSGLGVGDLDDDGLTDVVVAQAGNDRIVPHYQTDAHKLAAGTAIPAVDGAGTVAVVDIDVDGDDDVVVAHGGWMAVGLYLQDGGNLGPERVFELPYTTAYGAQALSVGDITGDTCPDVVIGGASTGLVTLRGGCWPDADGDGVRDDEDSCPLVPDTGADRDGDGVGDACDVCPDDVNIDQADADGDGFGDACDICPTVGDTAQSDADADGVGDACDVCPRDADPAQADADGDGHGDACDICPGKADDQSDRDLDGRGDACDSCPAQADDGTDGDGDGIGDLCDCAPGDETRPTHTGACGAPGDLGAVGLGCATVPEGGLPVLVSGLLVALLGGRRRRRDSRSC